MVVLSVACLLVYQAWPWREWQFEQGVLRYFDWLAPLNSIVVGPELKHQIFGLLFFVPIGYGTLTLSWPGGVLAWLIAIIWVIPAAAPWPNNRLVVNLLLLLLPALLVAIVSGERRWREGERRHYAEIEHERQAYVASLVETQEIERQRIAQEIHDDTLQTLMVVANKCDSLASSSTDETQTAGNLWVKQQVLQTMSDLRRMSMNLRPSILDNFGLVSGIRWLINNAANSNDCCLNIEVNGDEQDMADLAEVTAFRITQEAISNISRHAQARNGAVTLTFDEDHLTLDIQDDGVGFRPPDRVGLYLNQNKLGLLGMEQRVHSVGGQIRLDSSPGQGTKLHVTIPYCASTKVIQGQDSRFQADKDRLSSGADI